MLFITARNKNNYSVPNVFNNCIGQLRKKTMNNIQLAHLIPLPIAHSILNKD